MYPFQWPCMQTMNVYVVTNKKKTMNLLSFRNLVRRAMRCVQIGLYKIYTCYGVSISYGLNFMWAQKKWKQIFYDYIRFDLDSFGNELRHLIHIEHFTGPEKICHFRSLLCCQHCDRTGTGRNIHKICIYVISKFSSRNSSMCFFLFCFKNMLVWRDPFFS